MKNKKCNLDCIPIVIIKSISHTISPIMSNIINKSVTTGVFPNVLKMARVVPFYKGGSPTSCGNYRPISILNIFAKIVEKVVYKQLSNYFESKNILIDEQYGFRSNKSTTQALLSHITNIYDSLDNDDYIFSLYLDFSKAFDSVDHSILLRKLYHYGIMGVPHDWVRSYLSDRKQFVSVNDVQSDIRTLTHSVPQGSNLGPLLFLIFINDLPKCNDYFKCVMFADDCTLSWAVPTQYLHNAHVDIHRNFVSVNRWLCANKIQVNIQKTKYVIYSCRGQLKLQSDVCIGQGNI